MTVLVCPRHGEIRPPMPPPELRNDLWYCPCGRTLLPPAVVEANRRRQGSYLLIWAVLSVRPVVYPATAT